MRTIEPLPVRDIPTVGERTGNKDITGNVLPLPNGGCFTVVSSQQSVLSRGTCEKNNASGTRYARRDGITVQ